MDKQRAEYIQAYENHMQDVQKELFLLREKVHILDTDETRALKMKSLEDDQNRLKGESVLLDEQNDVMRQKLRTLTLSMQSVERDRDWLLERLQKAKKKYTKLQKTFAAEKLKLSEFDEVNDIFSSSVSLSQESSLFLDTYKMKKLQKSSSGNTTGQPATRTTGTRSGTGVGSGHTTATSHGMGTGKALSSSEKGIGTDHRQGWRQRLVAEIAVSRSNPLLPIVSTHRPSSPSKMHVTASAPNLKQHRTVTSMSPERVPGSEMTNHGKGRRIRKKTKLERSAVALLVAMRARQEAIREVVDKCFKSCDRGAALLGGKDATQSTVVIPLPELVVACMESIVASRDAPEADNDLVAEARREFIMQLIYHPDTYLAISDVISGKFAQQLVESDRQAGDNEIHKTIPGIDLQQILDLHFGDEDNERDEEGFDDDYEGDEDQDT